MKNSVKILFFLIVILGFSLSIFTKVDNKIYAGTENAVSQINRFIEVLKAINQYYVEEVEVDKLVTGAIKGMLEELDPHSVYIESKQLERVSEEFDGYFYGIGIEFIIQNKILTVVAPIMGTPSERLGIRPGDKIVKIEGQYTYGIAEEEVKQKLRGPRGTKITITLKRAGVAEPFDLTIIRDKIPIYSVLASFMLDRKTGYILLGRFSKTTSIEIDRALQKLKSLGMQQIILDLRNNSGGYLDQAVAIVDKFFDDGKKIVSTRGRIDEANEVFTTTHKSDHNQLPLIILINNGSASASEIVAGAIQDWDRGLIVGETSFGKGLVQSQIELSDHSAIRLTIARYYTPSGRLIQRSYKNGIADYYLNYSETVENNPEASQDNRQFSEYLTYGGRKVFGGGGIQPDVVIHAKSITEFTRQLLSKRLCFEFGLNYANWHKELGLNFNAFKNYFVVDETVMEEFGSFIKKTGIQFQQEALEKDLDSIQSLIKSEIARNLWDSQKYYEIYINGDHQVQEALKLFPKAAQIAGLQLSR